MSGNDTFNGFPGIGGGTMLPNLFFLAILPKLQDPGDLLAFLWVSQLVQQQRGEARFVTADEIWAQEPARDSFQKLAGGRAALERGLGRCTSLGALLALRLSGEARENTVYFVNNPPSRRAVARARAGALQLRPAAVALPVPAGTDESRPDIFRLYEENIGTITPLIGERLLAATDDYPPAWIEDAFREAAELNRRNWRYIERILQNWAQEGRGDEAPQRDSFEARKQRYLSGPFGNLPLGRP